MTARATIANKFHQLFPNASDEKIQRTAEELLTGIIVKPQGEVTSLRNRYLIAYFERNQATYFRERAKWLFAAVAGGEKIPCTAVQTYQVGTGAFGELHPQSREQRVSVIVPDPLERNSPGYSPEMSVEEPRSARTSPPLRLVSLDEAEFSPSFFGSVERVLEALHSFRPPSTSSRGSPQHAFFTSTPAAPLTIGGDHAGFAPSGKRRIERTLQESVLAALHSFRYQHEPSEESVLSLQIPELRLALPKVPTTPEMHRRATPSGPKDFDRRKEAELVERLQERIRRYISV
jgi:hypothetical protein